MLIFSYMKKTDRRVARTKRLILDAVMNLLSEKKLQDITVREITDRADIDRKTFYNHYGSIYEIVEEQEDNLVDFVAGMFNKEDILSDIKNPGKIIGELARMNRELAVYSKILRTDHGLLYGIKLAERVKDKIMASMTKMNLKPEEAEIFVIYVFSGIVAVYRHWRTAGKDLSFDTISDILNKMCLGSVEALLKKS